MPTYGGRSEARGESESESAPRRMHQERLAEEERVNLDFMPYVDVRYSTDFQRHKNQCTGSFK